MAIALATPTIAMLDKQAFVIDDYFKVQRITELALSSDGEMIAYTVQSQSLELNRSLNTVYISKTSSREKPLLIDEIQDARSLAWIPGTRELAFLRNEEGVSQIYSINSNTEEIRQHTNGEETVVKFRFAPDGGSLAWITVDPDDKPVYSGYDYKRSRLYDRIFNGEEGVVIDSENTVVYDFVNPDYINITERPPQTLWARRHGESAFPVDAPGQIKSFYWSSNGSKLSISYVENEMRTEAFASKYTSLGIFDISTRSFEILARARPPSETEGGQYYSGGEWVPGDEKLFIRRTTERDRWVSSTEWARFDLAMGELSKIKERVWREIEIYSLDSDFLPVDENTVFSNKAIGARQFLYQITPSGMVRADIFQNLEGSASLVQFSENFERAVFVNESLSRPPEIFVWNIGRSTERLSYLNSEVHSRQLPNPREVTWQSVDGVAVQGWLIEPVGEESHNKPWPLVTFVHGGPALAMLDEFAFYFKANGGLWPYPFEAYALNGMAVFIPNYRGTKTFGDKFTDPTSLDGEPVDDIISGIEHLIDRGIADPELLAISGHSHGAWLAPLVMTRAPFLFQAGSFAEGSLNTIVSYNLMPEFLNREVHDKIWGTSLYDDPQRYIDLSPDLHFEGLETAVLFEAGAKSLAVAMMGSPKAARRSGLPAEFVVYPMSGHNLVLPRLKRESAERNLDWFQFWLNGEEDPSPSKVEQYERWRKMRVMR